MSDSDLLESTLETLRVGVLSVDASGRVELQNPEASRILGFSAFAALGRSLVDVLDPEHPLVLLVGEVLSTGRDLSLNAAQLPTRSEDQVLSVDISGTPRSEARKGVVVMLHDRTIGRRLEDMAAERARSDIYAQLATGLAHEIRNPLGGIRGTAELLEKRLDDAALRKYPSLIRDETDRIRRLLDEFSELARGGELQPRHINLHEIIDKMLSLQKGSKSWNGIAIRREYDPSIPDLLIDPDRMTQVFLNLCRNSAQAMAGAGTLTLRTRVETIYQIRSTSSSEKPTHMVRIEIVDTGPGIPDDELPHIFTPFVTTRDRGTGLGLPIAQHWVMRHGGRIEVGHGHAGGTRVRVLLPVSRQR